MFQKGRLLTKVSDIRPFYPKEILLNTLQLTKQNTKVKF